ESPPQPQTASADDKPMAAFMGAKWGISVNEFLQTFRYRDRLKKRGGLFHVSGFYIKRFRVNDDLTFKKIAFFFTPEDESQKLKLKKQNYDRLFLDKVMIWVKPIQYETYYKAFENKYGEPTKFLGNEAIWIDEELDRVIYMKKYREMLYGGYTLMAPFAGKLPDVAKVANKMDKLFGD
ncbi:MAG: hypothetical protein GY765_06285, partial [bacterium]|nr:hypothetical protein [bacterium]